MFGQHVQSGGRILVFLAAQVNARSLGNCQAEMKNSLTMLREHLIDVGVQLAAQHPTAHRRQIEALVARLRGRAAGTRTEDSHPGPSGASRGQAALRVVK